MRGPPSKIPLPYRRYAARLLWAPLAKRLYGSHPDGRGTVGPQHYRPDFLSSYRPEVTNQKLHSFMAHGAGPGAGMVTSPKLVATTKTKRHPQGNRKVRLNVIPAHAGIQDNLI